jgi:hypothetical protein
VSAGLDYTCALVQDGTAQCWGDNAHGQLGNGSNVGSSLPVAVAGFGESLGWRRETRIRVPSWETAPFSVGGPMSSGSSAQDRRPRRPGRSRCPTSQA